MPKEDRKVKLLDGGIGMQGWRDGNEAPVLWTAFPRHEGSYCGRKCSRI
jgi:hypothetical protein